jgi:hypothetical protein
VGAVLWDTGGQPGLHVVIGARLRSFLLRYYLTKPIIDAHGKPVLDDKGEATCKRVQQVVTIGRYPGMSLKAARQRAAEWREVAGDGVNLSRFRKLAARERRKLMTRRCRRWRKAGSNTKALAGPIGIAAKCKAG